MLNPNHKFFLYLAILDIYLINTSSQQYGFALDLSDLELRVVARSSLR